MPRILSAAAVAAALRLNVSLECISSRQASQLLQHEGGKPIVPVCVRACVFAFVMRLLFSGKSPRANLHPLLFFFFSWLPLHASLSLPLHFCECMLSGLISHPLQSDWPLGFPLRRAPFYVSITFILTYRRTLSPRLSHFYHFYSRSFSPLCTVLQSVGMGRL